MDRDDFLRKPNSLAPTVLSCKNTVASCGSQIITIRVTDFVHYVSSVEDRCPNGETNRGIFQGKRIAKLKLLILESKDESLLMQNFHFQLGESPVMSGYRCFNHEVRLH